MSYPAYVEMKDSGVEWLGDVPKHWEVNRLRFVCQLNPPKSELEELPADMVVSFLPMEKIGTEGEMVLDENRALESVMQGFTYFRDGDVIVAKITPCFENGKGAACIGLTGGIGFGSTEFHVLRPHGNTSSKYIFYLTRSLPFRSIGTASMLGSAGQKRVPEDYIKNFASAFPPPDEQRAIVRFLDRKTDEIDALIKLKEHQCELLDKKRQVLISHAVTRGLDSSVPLRPSGYEWLGDIPARWRIISVRHLIQRQDLETQDGNHGELHPVASEYVGSGVPFIMANNIRDGRILFDTCKFITKERACGLRIGFAKPNDVLLTHKGTLGEAAIVPNDIPAPFLMLTPQVTYYRTKTEDISPEYLYYFFCSLAFKNQMDVISSIQSTRGYVGLLAQKEFRFVLPLREEQEAIVSYLNRETARIDGMAKTINTQIKSLHNYRQALISAAVTGKIDVRGEGV
jgi:type I restriction enzyme, S subunit